MIIFAKTVDHDGDQLWVVLLPVTRNIITSYTELIKLRTEQRNEEPARE